MEIMEDRLAFSESIMLYWNTYNSSLLWRWYPDHKSTARTDIELIEWFV